MSKAAADKAAKDLEEEQTTRRRHEARVGKVKEELRDTIARCEFLEHKSLEQASELTKALESLKEARVDVQGACQEIQQVKILRLVRPLSCRVEILVRDIFC